MGKLRGIEIGLVVAFCTAVVVFTGIAIDISTGWHFGKIIAGIFVLAVIVIGYAVSREDFLEPRA